MTDLSARVAKLEADYAKMGQELSENTRVTRDIRNDTKELLEIFSDVKVYARFFMGTAKLAKWIGGLAAAIAAIWYVGWAIVTGNTPFHK